MGRMLITTSLGRIRQGKYRLFHGFRKLLKIAVFCIQTPIFCEQCFLIKPARLVVASFHIIISRAVDGIIQQSALSEIQVGSPIVVIPVTNAVNVLVGRS